MLKHGLELIAAENFKKAHTLFEQAISERPQDLRAYYYAGFAASRLEDLETAVLRFEQYLMLRPHDVGVMTDLGRLYERSGKWAQARRCYQRVLAWTPDSEIAGERLKELSRFQSGLTEGVEPQSTEQLLGEDTASTVSAPPFRVTYYLAAHGRLLTDILKAFMSGLNRLARLTGWRPSEAVRVQLLCPEGEMEGSTDPQGIVLAVDAKHLGERPFLQVLVTHEYAHFHLGLMTRFSDRVPWWFQEGFAQHVSQTLTPVRLNDMADAARESSLIPLKILERNPARVNDPEVVRACYLAAHTAMAFMAKAFGEAGIRTFIRILGENGTPDEAFSAMGTTYEQFETRWIRWMAAGAASGDVRLTEVVGNG
jgi:tetratricopeptide (TPR) repeat protein